MFEKNLNIAFLLDFYGEVLSEHSRGILEMYYCDDLSLAEIAQSVGISRQGVRHIIKKGEEELTALENKLGLANHYTALQNAAERLLQMAKTLQGDVTSQEAKAISDAIKECALLILEKNQE